MSFEYNNGVSHLLSAIIPKKTNTSLENFVVQHLFQPLGIHEFTWWSDSYGINTGRYSLWLAPYGMSKIG
ncbi:MAG: serine hydrolase [Candidatus Heimdallarchaeota archaeon]|nr:serine hydrolase [Candidatus Heimdallarchaeota archaeon]